MDRSSFQLQDVAAACTTSKGPYCTRHASSFPAQCFAWALCLCECVVLVLARVRISPHFTPFGLHRSQHPPLLLYQPTSTNGVPRLGLESVFGVDSPHPATQPACSAYSSHEQLPTPPEANSTHSVGDWRSPGVLDGLTSPLFIAAFLHCRHAQLLPLCPAQASTSA
eukprot:GGOE01008969.1.p1 GENE.GGOE01008969.1~~GGOE01008969.1.p1  ORF type:complete len:167 (-),score=4.48 GGOE01008969.1:111-611(-)